MSDTKVAAVRDGKGDMRAPSQEGQVLVLPLPSPGPAEARALMAVSMDSCKGICIGRYIWEMTYQGPHMRMNSMRQGWPGVYMRSIVLDYSTAPGRVLLLMRPTVTVRARHTRSMP